MLLIPEERLGTTASPLPERAIALYWASVGGEGAPRLGRHRTYEVWAERWVGEVATPSPALTLSHQTAEVLARSPLRIESEPLAEALALQAGLQWAEGHLSPEVAIARILESGDYGHGFVGLATAAAGYFGLPVAELNEAELAMLIVSLRDPDDYNPWCHLEENRHAILRLGRGGPVVGASTRLRPARPGRCAMRSALS